MELFLKILTILAVAVAATLPITYIGFQSDVLVSLKVLSALNFIGWTGVLVFLLARFDFRRRVNHIARSLGIETRFKSFEVLLGTLLSELSRKNEAFSLNLVERKISSKKELSRALENIVALAFKLLNAESAELALFDKESGFYHSSFVLGKPFRTGSQAMLSKAAEGESIEESPDVLVQPIAFAGTTMGSLRVGLQKNSVPSVGDREIMRLLAIQSGLAIINAQYTEQLLHLRRASEESVKAKTGFLANLSHEIRGPLGIMLNAVELVLDGLCGAVTDDQLETLRMVRSNGEHLLELINDVLDYAKVESGKLKPQPVDIMLDDLLKDISGVVRSQAEAKSHRLIFKPSEEVLAICCDRRHLRQMLINMLTNAIKYTPDGGTIEVWAERVPVNKIRINVKDSGVGIDESDRYKVFSAFERIENAYSINQVGAGLGMPLTKKLAEVNGALIDFRSTAGKGTHFWLLFKAIQYNANMLIENEVTEKEAQGKGECILIMEKDEGELNMLNRYLSHIGFKIIATRSKAEALRILGENKIDLALIDNNIIDGPHEDLLAGIREKSISRHLPLLLLTSRGFVFDLEKYLRQGVDRCLVKPVDLKALGITCRKLIDGTSQEPEPDAQKNKEQKEKQAVQTRLMELDDLLH